MAPGAGENINRIPIISLNTIICVLFRLAWSRSNREWLQLKTGLNFILYEGRLALDEKKTNQQKMCSAERISGCRKDISHEWIVRRQQTRKKWVVWPRCGCNPLDLAQCNTRARAHTFCSIRCSSLFAYFLSVSSVLFFYLLSSPSFGSRPHFTHTRQKNRFSLAARSQIVPKINIIPIFWASDCFASCTHEHFFLMSWFFVFWSFSSHTYTFHTDALMAWCVCARCYFGCIAWMEKKVGVDDYVWLICSFYGLPFVR